MMRALNTAGAGMLAQQTNLDVLSNNLSNSNTTAYKSQRAQFSDMVYQTIATGSSAQNSAPNPVQVGLGTLWTGNVTDNSQGAPIQTGDPLNMMISGSGYFEVTGPSGQPAYTRDGTFTVDPNGQLVTQQGYLVTPNITIPSGTTSISISATGQITGVKSGSTATDNLGQITITMFPNPAGLTRLGNNLYQQSDGSGAASAVTPGQDGSGTIQSGYVEGSNVQVVNEMVAMISAQRTYEINSKAIQTADSMLGVVNNLKQ